MRKCTRVLSLCLMLALMLSLGMPAAFADDAHEAAPSPGTVEKLPEEDAPKAEVPAEQEKQTETETAVKPEEPAASSEPAKEGQADTAKTVSGYAEPSGKGAKICIHDWQTESSTEATCTEYGKLHQKCSKCEETRTIPDLTAVPKLHDYSILVETKREATCTLVGWGVYKCVRCDKTLEKAIPMKDHVFNAKNVIPGFGLIDDNNHTVKCENCSFIWTVAHNKVTVSEKPATCTEDGYSAGTYCADGCGYDTRTVYSAPGEHSWGEWTVKTPATCTVDGLEVRKCSACGATESRPITADGHKSETISGKEATCTEAGLTEGTKCSVCGEILVAQEVIPAEGHTWGEWELTTAATCTQAGVETRTCSVCQASETRPIAATGHTEEAIPDQKATCTEPGSVGGKRCSVCKAVLEEPEVVPATGHDWGLWADAKDGWRHVRFCANDPTHKQYGFHKMGNWVTVKYNTETTDGYRERWCQEADCDYHEVQVIRAGSPKTGDSSNILFYSGLCLASLCAASGLIVFAKRRKEQ